ncbi:hypothetical protein WAF17_04810 [Bernardetia sp. ABR2-2B]|uniref:hypothetical protein n=1 Tax=Bernardetia sp. ABR2-2B TaxID=3127472 RepID=UPI0030CEF0B5
MKNSRLLFVFAFVISFFFIESVYSQTIKKREGGLYLFQEFRFQKLSSINSSLKSYGLNSASGLIFSSGAGGYGWFGRVKIGGEGAYFRNDNDESNQNTELQGFGGNFYTAYLINPTSKVHLLPLIALGGESINLLASKERATTDFSQALEQPQTLYLQTGSFYLKTALQLEYKAQKSVMGLQIGYQYSSSQEWQLNDKIFSNAPSDQLSNFFFRFTIGLE